MIKLKSRKSQVFYGIVAGIIGAIIVSVIGTSTLKKDFDVIGKSSLQLLETSKEAEKALFYIDQSAENSAYSAIYQLGKQGGFSKNNDCSSYYGYELWQALDSKKNLIQCFPENPKLEESFKSIFSEHLNLYLKNFNIISPYPIPLDNYDIQLQGNLEITGLAKTNLELPILTEKQIEIEIKEEKQIEKSESANIPKKVEGLVPIKKVSCSGSCMAKPEVNKRLEIANQYLKEKYGLELYVYSSYRSLEHQKALWNGDTPEKYNEKYENPQIRRKFVCNPNVPNPYQECPHLTGGAVDVKLKGKAGTQMTSYDWQIVKEAMNYAGFVLYPLEAWHFEYETERWARAQKAGVTEIV